MKKLRSLIATAALALPASVAIAQAGPSPTTSAFISIGGAQSEDSDIDPARSLSIGLERSEGDYFFGAAIGLGGSSLALPESVELTDTDGFLGEVWWGLDQGGTVFSLSAGYGFESADGTIDVTLPLAAVIQTVELDAEVRSWSLLASIGHSFGETWVITPSAAIGYGAAETEAVFTTQNGFDVSGASEAEGYTASANIGLYRDFNPSVGLSLGASVLTTDNAAASRFNSRRGNVFAPEAAESEDSASWAEIYAGADLQLAEGLVLAPSIGTTLGLDVNSVYGSLTLRRSF
jgi:Autotransporter beta-domain